MDTIFVKESEQARKWYVIDAAGKPLGRVAAKAAAIARGKNKVTYTKNQNMGDFVVIINAEKVAVTGGKEQKKIYHHHIKHIYYRICSLKLFSSKNIFHYKIKLASNNTLSTITFYIFL